MTMTFSLQQLTSEDNPLARHYTRFQVDRRLLFTGHSHQAWPDRAFAGQVRAWNDAAHFVDEKWERAMKAANAVREGYRRLLDDPTGLYSLGTNTFELLVRLLSALPLQTRRRLVTTDAEFHSARRLFERLEETGFQVVRVAAHPAEEVGARLAAVVDDRTAAVLASTVFFTSGQIADGFDLTTAACRRHGATLVLDVYHQVNIVPFSVVRQDLEDAFILGGGYKYCQLGEGNAFLRFPADCSMRPVITGWFAEFGQLSDHREDDKVAYDTGHQRFAGATYDPTSHYRAAEVFSFFEEYNLHPQLLRNVSQFQVERLCRLFDELDLDPDRIRRDRSVPVARVAGFLALETKYAGTICKILRDAEMATDFRGDILRLGPAPYLSCRQLDRGMALLGQTVNALEGLEPPSGDLD